MRWIGLAIIGFAAGWLLAGCAVQDARQADTLLAVGKACDAYSAALEVLTPHKQAGLLTDREVATVDLANGVSDQFCLPGAPPPADPVSALVGLADALTRVMFIVAAKEQEEA